MKVSLNWLKDFVKLPDNLTPEKLSYDLTMTTVEVEGFDRTADHLDKILVGKVTQLEKHPNADKLRLVTVDIGRKEAVKVVCGGSNLVPGMLIAYADLGAKVRWHGQGEPIVLEAAEIRGVKSLGMICSSNEIGLGDLFPVKAEKEIVDLSAFGFSGNFTPGAPLAEALGMDDIIFEIDNKSLTNRPDLWGHLGIARELSAIYQCPFKEPELPALKDYLKQSAGLKVEIQAPELCARYIGVSVTGVKVQQSPLWMQVRLSALGQRPINFIVDITNYVMFAVGQPLHAFDARKISGSSIVVRPAKDKEKLKLLDGAELTLTPNNLVIADEKQPVALAGVMGGKDSGIEADVKDLVLESANFQAVPLRRTASQFKLRTESSMRFEKGIDTERTELGMRMLISMLLENQTSAKVQGGVDVFPKKPEKITVEVERDFIVSRIGKDLSVADMKALLVRLGFEVSVKGEKFTVLVPPWRATGDVSLPVDIVEEVARLYGYDNIDFVPLTVQLSKSVGRSRYDLERRVKEYLAYEAGMSEVFSYPWCEESLLAAVGVKAEDCLSLSDAPSPSQRLLHTTLAAQLLGAVRGNLRFQNQFSIFEMARVFDKRSVSSLSLEKEKLPHQPKRVAGAVVGTDKQEVFLRAKGILAGLIRSTMIEPIELKPEGDFSAWISKGVSLGIYSGKSQIGELGLVSASTLKKADIERAQVAIFELSVDALKPLATLEYEYTPLPRYPQTECDFSLLFDESTQWAKIEKEAAEAHPFVKGVRYLEEYRGEQVPAGKKSLAFRVVVGNPDASLTSKEIQETSNKIIKRLESLGGVLR